MSQEDLSQLLLTQSQEIIGSADSAAQSTDPAKRAGRPRKLVAAITAGVVVLAGGGVALSFALSGGSNGTSLPASAGGLVLETDAASKAKATDAANALRSVVNDIGGVQAGAYGSANDGHYTMVYLEFPSGSALEQEFKGESPDDIVTQLVDETSMAGVHGTSVDTSAALSCGTTAVNSQLTSTCVWAGPVGIAFGYFYSDDQESLETTAQMEMDALAMAAFKSSQ